MVGSNEGPLRAYVPLRAMDMASRPLHRKSAGFDLPAGRFSREAAQLLLGEAASISGSRPRMEEQATGAGPCGRSRAICREWLREDRAARPQDPGAHPSCSRGLDSLPQVWVTACHIPDTQHTAHAWACRLHSCGTLATDDGAIAP